MRDVDSLRSDKLVKVIARAMSIKITYWYIMAYNTQYVLQKFYIPCDNLNFVYAFKIFISGH